MTVPFDEPGISNLRYTWWAGEGDTAETVSEWEVLSLSQTSPTYVPDQAAVGMFLRVTVSYTAADGLFRAARSATSTSPVADVAGPGALIFTETNPTVGDPIAAGIPTDPDGGISEENTFTYVWSSSATDPAVGATWVDYVDAEGVPNQTNNAYAPTEADVGHWIRVTINYTDGGGNPETVSAWSTAPVAAAP
jgi:hypothetical protein